MRNGERVSLEVLNFYVRIKIRVATHGTDHSVSASTQSIAASTQTKASLFCDQASQHSSP